MSGQVSGGSQKQNGTQSGTQSGSNTGVNYNQSDVSNTGTSSITPTTTAGWNSIDSILRGNLGGGGLSPDQQFSADAWKNYISTDPNNGVAQMVRGNGLLDRFTNTQAHTAAAPGAITAPGGSEYAANYQQPFQQQVVDATQADALNSLKTGLNEINANYGGSMGNGRSGVAAGQAVGDFTRGLTSNIAGLRSQGFDTSQGLGQADAQRQYGANTQNVGNAINVDQFNQSQKNIADQTSMGAIQQQINNGGAIMDAGGRALDRTYNYGSGGNDNLFKYLGIQPTGQSSTSTGNQSGTNYGFNLDDFTGKNDSTSSSQGSQKGGGVGAKLI